ncbi:MAG TPA: HNH endonuclease [Terriglobales bacterium]|nr:HNH endonuclease [Terriglobales bacterium]
MKLRRNQFCPVHHSRSCCGREPLPNRPKLIRLGVQRIEDAQHPRGYRELRSPAEMRKLLDRKIVEQNRTCAICRIEFTDYNDIVPDHKIPKGMGGSWRDDHPDNIQAVHWWCNEEKGSARMQS